MRRHMHDLLKVQENYVLSPQVPSHFSNGEVVRQVIVTENGMIAAFPSDTSKHEISTVAKILDATVEECTFTADYVFYKGTGSTGSGIRGELITIPGIVQDNVVLQVFPVLKGNYSQEVYDTVAGVAKLIGGEVKNIVYRAIYNMV